MYSSYQDAVGLDGEAIECECTNFPEFSSVSALREIRIILMSMFNDIVWKKNVENCISNAEEVRNYAIKFMTGHRTFLGPGSEEKWYGDSYGEKRTVELHRQQNGTAIRRDWSSCLQKYQCFESWNFEAKERQLYHSLQGEIL